MENVSNSKTPSSQREFKRPVSWLLGRQLLSGMKWIAGYTFFGEKIDPKDWMTAQRPIDIPFECTGHDLKNEFWFDYIADTGDGMSATYTIAYLCQSDLYTTKQGAPGPGNIALLPSTEFSDQLPRGAFLFVGGDTAYHIADTASIKERFQTPFNWAYDDLVSQGQTIDRKPIYGIPANHDYYDALDGFNRQFRRPIGGDRAVCATETDVTQPQLCLKGFCRQQEASFVALHLPFDWWFWGLDAQEGKIDKRQWAYFVETFKPELLQRDNLFGSAESNYAALHAYVPAKLIVATPEPSTVMGKYAQEKAGLAVSLQSLGLEPSFLRYKNGKLSTTNCRLDISGDTHHYERYWGSADGSVNYASVVAGGGGAFLHPSHCTAGEVTPQVIYPSPGVSYCLFTSALLNPWNIATGGFIWLAGAIAATLSYFALTVSQSTWSLLELVPDEKRPAGLSYKDSFPHGLLANAQEALDTSALESAAHCCSASYYFDMTYILVLVAMLVYWWKVRVPMLHAEAAVIDNIKWEEGIAAFTRPIAVACLPLLGFMLIDRNSMPAPFLSSILIAFFTVAAGLLFTLNRNYSDILILRSRYCREQHRDWIPLWLFGIAGIMFASFGFLRYGSYAASPITLNLLVTLVWGALSLGLVAIAVRVGNGLKVDRRNRTYLMLGCWHAILQLATPILLIVYGSWSTVFWSSLLAICVTLFAGRLFTSDIFAKPGQTASENKLSALQLQDALGWKMFVGWIALGAITLIAGAQGDATDVTLARVVAAGVVGAVFACIWFGWYLAVSLTFHGHNNEAGGGARSERYRHMIRFRVRADSLTGYVIGFSSPYTDVDAATRRTARFDLIDRFEIRLPQT